ncbi:phasin family protein [Arboricoccus pini]|uniref:Phasin family protein n=1 Tax=Arboricoccus pini TaxID=1963835 RepID=A0A212QB14_9PROT|nr:phasin family protein [Arboricoccus pini]SNB56581.1 phasin family protein [Arboricoccus pini]
MATINNPSYAPKFDIESVLALYKSNIETCVAAQKIMFDFSQTLAKRQVETVKESFAKAEALMKGFDGKKLPQSYVDDAKAAIEKALADVKEAMDMGMKAQNDVVDLFVKRASANFDGVKTMAA